MKKILQYITLFVLFLGTVSEAKSLDFSYERIIEVHKAGNNVNPKNAAIKVKLNKQLASESQMKNPGKPIIKYPELNACEHLAEKYGGNAKDWVKKASDSYKSSDGKVFETHWYENLEIGKKVEFKTKIY